ncbi:MAG: hypothetical protein KF802_00090 [Bdellovibrionaceae bacterium]|nr:hypothetical protein [Pseudobdellovibrionaceae bacterium]
MFQGVKSQKMSLVTVLMGVFLVGCADQMNPGQGEELASAIQTDLSQGDDYRPFIYSVENANKTICDNEASMRLGTNYACSMGGGCTISNTRPSSSAPAARPNLYGACILARADGGWTAAQRAQYQAAQDAQRPEVARLATYLHGLYTGFLGRQPDLLGFYSWLNVYNGADYGAAKLGKALMVGAENTTRATAKIDSGSTTSVRNYLARVYVAVMGRPGAESEIGYWTREITVYGRSIDAIEDEFLTSAEFVNRVQGLGLVVGNL